MAPLALVALFSGVDGATALTEGEAKSPLQNGDLIVMHGYYDKQDRTGPGVALIVRPGHRPHQYVVQPYGAEQEYWSHHILSEASLTIQLQSKKEEEDLLAGAWKNKKEELIEKWCVISSIGNVPDLSNITWMSRPGVAKITKSVIFACEMITSSNPPVPKTNTKDKRHGESKSHKKGAGVQKLEPRDRTGTREVVTEDKSGEENDGSDPGDLAEARMLSGMVGGTESRRSGKNASAFSPTVSKPVATKKTKTFGTDFVSKDKGLFAPESAKENEGSIAASSSDDIGSREAFEKAVRAQVALRRKANDEKKEKDKFEAAVKAQVDAELLAEEEEEEESRHRGRKSRRCERSDRRG